MDSLQQLIEITGFQSLEWRMLVMWVVAGILFYLAVFKQFEPLLLVPIAFGALLANLPTEKLVNHPAEDIRSPIAGQVVFAWAAPGDEIILPRVPAERPGNLESFRDDPDGLRALFAAEAADFENGRPRLLFLVRPPLPDGADERTDGVEVTLAGAPMTVYPEDRPVWSDAAGKATAAPVAIGDNVVAGQILLGNYSPAKPGLFYMIRMGIVLELFPPLIFLGVGALTDFGPLIANPRTFLLGAAAQVGIFLTFIMAMGSNLFTAKEAAAIGIIGGADGPTSIFIANSLAPHLLAPIAVAAYSYMALVPVLQPPIMRLLTTKKERAIRMQSMRKVGKLEKLVFALMVTVVCILLVPPAAPLIGMLMLGNFLRECGVTERLVKASQNEIINIVTIFLGTGVGITMAGDRFLRGETLAIMALGVFAFAISTASGVLMAKLMNVVSKNKINPLIGAAGVSAVPMAARVAHSEGQKADPGNFLLMHAMGPNVAGVIGSALAAGFFLAMLGSH